MRVHPLIIWIGGSELAICTLLRNHVNTCDGSVFLLPMLAAAVGLAGYVAAPLLFTK
jgi:hypothetical protein